MVKQKTIPTLRFPEFKEDWSQRRLIDAVEINPIKENLPKEFVYIDLESVVDGILLKEQLINLDEAPSRAQRLLEKGDILFQMVRPYQKNNLYFDKDGIYVASTGYAQIRTNNDSKFVYQYLHYQPFVDKVIERCTGTSYPAINSTDLGNIVISLPSLPEQQKIASFLTSVDERFAQLTQKKALLEQYKKGVMQKIFSQEIRLKIENAAGELVEPPKWEEKRFGDIAHFSKGKGISKSDVSENGETECIRYGELYTHYRETIKEVISTTNLDPKNLVLSEENDVIIPASGETQIDIATASCVLKSGVALGGDLNIIKSLNNGVFLSYYLNNKKKIDIANLAQGVSVVHLYSSQLALLELKLPCIKEQNMIANFITSIDKKIEGVNKQLEQTKLWKKGLLQQMFV